MMTEGERMVWAAVYASRWAQALEKREVMGVPMSVPTCIEEAWVAVHELRGGFWAFARRSSAGSGSVWKGANTMTEGERMVWAAVYASRWAQTLEKREVMGVPVSVPHCIEEAWAAVHELRGAREEVQQGWGDGDPVLGLLDEMLGIEVIKGDD